MTARKLFVTTALPYANGNFHIGHIMEYIQADIWVRFQRMQGNEVNFVGADDAHGAPIMIAAEKAGKTPQQFVADIAAGRKQYLDGFHIAFDNWHSTDAPENHELAQQIYRDLKAAGLIETRTIEQFFDPEKNMFLPDRFIKGECPKCHAKDQYGDNCEVCGAVYAPTDLINPTRPCPAPSRCSRTPSTSSSSCPTRAAWSSCEWTQDGQLQPEVANKIKEWFSVRTNPDGTSEGLGDWDISRDAPYFGIEIPTRRASTSTSGWTRPSATWPRSRTCWTSAARTTTPTWPTRLEQYHFIGKDIITFHTLFWPAMLQFSGRKTPTSLRARLPDRQQRREDEQEPRHRPGPAQVPEPGHEPRVAALLPGRQAQRPQRRHRLQPRRLHGPRQLRPDRQVRQHRQRAAGFIAKRFDGQLGTVSADGEACWPLRARPRRRRALAEREYGKALREIMLLADRVNAYVDPTSPGSWPSRGHGRPPARRVQHLHRGLPPADHLPQAGAAGLAARSRLPERGAARLRRRQRAGRRPPIGATST
jgi:methionyl-tRNA synthetase